jgi:hypothetical protein
MQDPQGRRSFRPREAPNAMSGPIDRCCARGRHRPGARPVSPRHRLARYTVRAALPPGHVVGSRKVLASSSSAFFVWNQPRRVRVGRRRICRSVVFAAGLAEESTDASKTNEAIKSSWGQTRRLCPISIRSGLVSQSRHAGGGRISSRWAQQRKSDGLVQDWKAKQSGQRRGAAVSAYRLLARLKYPSRTSTMPS